MIRALSILPLALLAACQTVQAPAGARPDSSHHEALAAAEPQPAPADQWLFGSAEAQIIKIGRASWRERVLERV